MGLWKVHPMSPYFVVLYPKVWAIVLVQLSPLSMCPRHLCVSPSIWREQFIIMPYFSLFPLFSLHSFSVEFFWKENLLFSLGYICWIGGNEAISGGSNFLSLRCLLWKSFWKVKKCWRTFDWFPSVIVFFFLHCAEIWGSGRLGKWYVIKAVVSSRDRITLSCAFWRTKVGLKHCVCKLQSWVSITGDL